MVDKVNKDTEEEKFIRLFNLGFEQVVAPALDELEKEVKREMNNRFDTVDTRFDNLERKVDRIAGKQLDHDNQFTNHEKRLKRLEVKRVVA